MLTIEEVECALGLRRHIYHLYQFYGPRVLEMCLHVPQCAFAPLVRFDRSQPSAFRINYHLKKRIGNVSIISQFAPGHYFSDGLLSACLRTLRRCLCLRNSLRLCLRTSSLLSTLRLCRTIGLSASLVCLSVVFVDLIVRFVCLVLCRFAVQVKILLVTL